MISRGGADGGAAPDDPGLDEWVRYVLAVVGFVVLGFFTKKFLTWTMGPIYFVTVLEVLPRTLRLLGATWARRAGNAAAGS